MADNYGLRILNANGNVQIDQNFRNFSLIAKGVVTASMISGSLTNAAQVDITLVGTSPFLAFKSDFAVSIYFVTSSGNTRTFRVTTNSDNAGRPFTYYGFDLIPTTSSSQWGMRVWYSPTQLAFDSGFRYFKPVAVGSVLVDNTDMGLDPTAGAFYRGYSTSKTWAVGILQPTLYVNTFVDVDPGGIVFWSSFLYHFGVQSLSDGMRLGSQLVATASGNNTQPFPGYGPFTGTAILIDVTGL